MRRESNEVLGENLPNFENIRQLTYTAQVVNEVLRLYPPAWAISRQVMNDQKIGEYLIPAKEQVFSVRICYTATKPIGQIQRNLILTIFCQSG
jgi:cytochrome P450